MRYHTGRLKETYIKSLSQHRRDRDKSAHSAQGKQRNPGNCRKSPWCKQAQTPLYGWSRPYGKNSGVNEEKDMD